MMRLVRFWQLEDLVFPLYENVLKPRGADIEKVATLFRATCADCGSLLNSSSLALVAATLVHGGDVQRSRHACPACGRDRLLVEIGGLSTDESSRLVEDRFFQTLKTP